MGIFSASINQNMCENFNLAWNEFDKCTSLAFRDLLSETDFADVTLVCDDDKQFTAHKVVLSACSSFVKRILLRNPHQKPLLYMRGMRHEDIAAILSFMYTGQTEVSQNNLDNFLKAAREIKVKGLNEDTNYEQKTEMLVDNFTFNKNSPEQLQKDENVQSSLYSMFPIKKEYYGATELTDSKLSLIENYEEYSDELEENSVKVRNDDDFYQNEDGKFHCGQCAYKAGTKTLLRRHQQNIHEGVKHPCNRCDRKFSSADALKVHIYQHEGKVFSCTFCDSSFVSPSQLSTHK